MGLHMNKIAFQFVAETPEEDIEVFLTVLAHQNHPTHTVTSGVYCIPDTDPSEVTSLLALLNESPLIEYAEVPPNTDE
jgi:TctA family transporter